MVRRTYVSGDDIAREKACISIQNHYSGVAPFRLVTDDLRSTCWPNATKSGVVPRPNDHGRVAALS